MAAEKNFENRIKKFLEANNCWYVKFFANRMTKRGIPDLLCCVNGFFVALEVKAEGGTPSDLQKLNIQRIRDANGIALVLYPRDFEDFKKLILELKEGKKA